MNTCSIPKKTGDPANALLLNRWGPMAQKVLDQAGYVSRNRVVENVENNVNRQVERILGDIFESTIERVNYTETGE